jgi:hypothetical protein
MRTYTPEQKAAKAKRGREHYATHRDAIRKQQREYMATPEGKAAKAAAARRYRATPEGKAAQAIADRRCNYGIERSHFDSMLIAQTGLCAVCAMQMVEPNVDHCHMTSRVRGLLCRYCNVAAGMLRDDPIRCRSLAEYLEVV